MVEALEALREGGGSEEGDMGILLFGAEAVDGRRGRPPLWEWVELRRCLGGLMDLVMVGMRDLVVEVVVLGLVVFFGAGVFGYPSGRRPSLPLKESSRPSSYSSPLEADASEKFLVDAGY